MPRKLSKRDIPEVQVTIGYISRDLNHLTRLVDGVQGFESKVQKVQAALNDLALYITVTHPDILPNQPRDRIYSLNGTLCTKSNGEYTPLPSEPKPKAPHPWRVDGSLRSRRQHAS